MKDNLAEVLYNKRLGGNYFRMGLGVGWSDFTPGQFVMVKVSRTHFKTMRGVIRPFRHWGGEPPPKAVGRGFPPPKYVSKRANHPSQMGFEMSSSDTPFLRRPFSILKSASPDAIEICYKVVGEGTRVLSGLHEGSKLPLLGPLGRGFKIQGSNSDVAILVAGGYGIAPFVGLAPPLMEGGIETHLYYGGKTRQDILFIDEFEKMGIACHTTTEDGSLGEKGIVTDLLLKDIDNYLINKDKTQTTNHEQRTTMYACGPEGLLNEVAKIAKAESIPAQLSYEAYMCCGMGVCLGCVIETKDGYKRVCREGPVFSAEDL